MLVRTVTAHGRREVCVSLDLAGGSRLAARNMGADLDRRGYLPPEKPMSRAEWERLMAKEYVQSPFREIVWEVCGLGVPILTAVSRARRNSSDIGKNARVSVQRILQRIEWPLR